MDAPHTDEHNGPAAAAVAAQAGQFGAELADRIRAWARELGFSAVGISDLEVSEAARHLRAWLDAGMHGTMEYMERHAELRGDPARLHPGALRAICVRMEYRPPGDGPDWVAREEARLEDDGAAVVSIYARGRDYHKVLRARLAELARRIVAAAEAKGLRAFCDSAPLFEVELARKAGLGWRGKHTLLLSREAGSMGFLGEVLTDLPLPVDAPVSTHCGSCTHCIDICPTRAIVAPYVVDARRCISYLTIEHAGAIPEELRPLMGNRIYGCDDCQLACPWNRYAQTAPLADFAVRNDLDTARLVELFAWTEADFEERLKGSAIFRIGYARWLRNLAVALGNARPSAEVAKALKARADHPDSVVREHVAWALERQGEAGRI